MHTDGIVLCKLTNPVKLSGSDCEACLKTKTGKKKGKHILSNDFIPAYLRNW